MTSLDTGTYGAKVQSWKRANPRDLLKRLIEDSPKSGKGTIFKMFREQLRGDHGEEFLDSIIEYWFANNYHSLIERAPPDKAATRAKVEQIKEKLKTRIHKEAQAILLDMVLPNGVLLRDSTFGYCAHLGGGLSRIGRKGKPGQIVGKHLSETEVRKLYAADAPKEPAAT